MYCAAYFNRAYIANNNDVWLCCKRRTPVAKYDGTFDFFHNDEYQRLRNIKERDPECKRCWIDEDSGVKSLRQTYNEKFGTDGVVDLNHLEFEHDNICNLKCVMCNENFSTEWGIEKFGKENYKSFLRQMILPKEMPENLRSVMFYGGEPFMTNRHITTLEKIEDKSAVDLFYTTNAQFPLSNEILDFLRQFKSISITCSIDAIGMKSEHFRRGSKWSTTVDFIDRLISYKDDFFSRGLAAHTTIHKQSFLELIEIENFLISKGIDIESCWNVGFVEDPVEWKMSELEEMMMYFIAEDLQSNYVKNKVQSRLRSSTGQSS